ncbi:redoxin domain-containing protein [Paludisphaera mucosa]|uniref:Redoxin domain-containing protein n=1 Tax=Paludisphaera mucosa TaxID=3030827 RepID=A0ABT6FHL3_9BACT|nr:redoxin domain-containing protein [Paludisphaera mucosa]MDG3007044.1 redoxin domain-containing protein [Paludisphaera mucosa]
MKSTLVPLVLGLLTCSGARAVADPPDLKPLAIGASAPDFNLPGVDGKNHALKDYADAKALVVVFTCNHCPTAQAYEARMEKLYEDYKAKGAAVVAISPNDPKAVRLDELGYTDLGDSFEDMKIRARDHKYSYPYLFDGETQAVARAYGALATPHVFVFDADRKLRYHGRFDDGEVKPPKSHDTIAAVDAVLAGTPVATPITRVFGCSTKWADKQADAAKSLAKWDAEPVTIEPIELDGVAKLAKNETDKFTVVNVWATWCGPCVQELPELVTMNRMYRGRNFRLVTISLDDPAKKAEALAMLKDKHVAATNYILNSPDRDAFAEALDAKWPGPVPYTIILAPGGEVVYRHSGGIDPLEVRRAIVAKLGRTY